MWTLSDAARAAPRQPRYDGGGPWDPAGCAGGKTIEAQNLEQLIRERFAWVRTVGGLRCEQLNAPSGPQLSIHAVGRALDVMTPSLQAAEGEQLANWLVENAAALGIQLVIWDGYVWQGSLRSPWQPYTGSNQHVDHVHVEVLRGGGSGGALSTVGDSSMSTAAAVGLGVAATFAVAGLSVGAWFAVRGRRGRRRRRR